VKRTCSCSVLNNAESKVPNKFTAQHNPPIESVLVRALFLGGHEDEQRMWRVMNQFTDDGALPSASYGLLLIGVNAMVYHQSTSEDDQGRKSAVCTIPGTPFVFVCDAAAIVAKPFGQHLHDNFITMMRRQGLRPCPACGGSGKMALVNQGPGQTLMPTMGTCATCGGEGFIPIEKPKDQDLPPPPLPPEEQNGKAQLVKRVHAETGYDLELCKEALGLNDWDVERAIAWLDERRKRLKLKDVDQ